LGRNPATRCESPQAVVVVDRTFARVEHPPVMAHVRFLSAGALQDAELVRAARAGDSTSLGILFERYRPHLLALAISLLGYRVAAEDAVHDTFVVALTRLADLKDPAAVGRWLHTT